jgi:hypothetical protein
MSKRKGKNRKIKAFKKVHKQEDIVDETPVYSLIGEKDKVIYPAYEYNNGIFINPFEQD